MPQGAKLCSARVPGWFAHVDGCQGIQMDEKAIRRIQLLCRTFKAACSPRAEHSARLHALRKFTRRFHQQVSADVGAVRRPPVGRMNQCLRETVTVGRRDALLVKMPKSSYTACAIFYCSTLEPHPCAESRVCCPTLWYSCASA
jgi:hypothetical protein